MECHATLSHLVSCDKSKKLVSELLNVTYFPSNLICSCFACLNVFLFALAIVFELIAFYLIEVLPGFVEQVNLEAFWPCLCSYFGAFSSCLVTLPCRGFLPFTVLALWRVCRPYPLSAWSRPL